MNNYRDLFYKDTYRKEYDNFFKEINNAESLGGETIARGLSLHFSNELNSVEVDIQEIEESVNFINENIDFDISYFNHRIKNLVEKVRGAILVERNTTSTIYSTVIPIDNQSKDEEETTAEISEGVIFGVSTKRVKEETVSPLTLSDLSFNNLRFKSLNKKGSEILENFEVENVSHNTLPFEFSIDLRGKIKDNSLVILNLKKYAIIEVYLDNILFKEKTLSNFFNIPVDENTISIGFRVYPTVHKSTLLSFNVIGITEMIYQEEVTYQSKDLSINEDLSLMVIDTCDNNDDPNVEIDYYFSLNGTSFEKIEEATKKNRDKLTNVQSIISLSKDTELSLLEMDGFKMSEGLYKYSVPDTLENQVDFEIEVLVPATVSRDNLYIRVKEDLTLSKEVLLKGSLDSIFVDGIEQNEHVFLHKGVRNISCIKSLLNLEYLENIFGKDQIFQDKVVKKIYKQAGDLKYIILDSYEIVQFTGDIKTIPKLYTKNVSKSVLVNSIRVKAVLRSLDYKTIPYISRFLVRGV